MRLRIELGGQSASERPEIKEWARYESRSRALVRDNRPAIPGRYSLDDAALEAGEYYKSTVVIKMELPKNDTLAFRDKLLAQSMEAGHRNWQKGNVGGIGITRSATTFFVTLALLESLKPSPLEQIKKQIIGQINSGRERQKLNAISWKSKSMEKAQAAAKNATLGKSTEFHLPSGMMAILVKFETADLIMTEKMRSEYLEPGIRQAGLGIAFGRSPQYPGGRYLFAFLFLLKID